MPGAWEGSCGRRDHIAHPPKKLEEVGWEDDGPGEEEREECDSEGRASGCGEPAGSGGGGEFIRGGVSGASEFWGNGNGSWGSKWTGGGIESCFGNGDNGCWDCHARVAALAYVGG
jgi:hypothetical protein